MRRGQVEALLADAYTNNGSVPDFDIIVPLSEVSSALSILKHLEADGTITSFSRREVQEASGRDDCINIYGYTG